MLTRPVLHAAAGEHTHNYFWSFLHGAHASGLKQADVILRYRSIVANWPKLWLHISKGSGKKFDVVTKSLPNLPFNLLKRVKSG